MTTGRAPDLAPASKGDIAVYADMGNLMVADWRAGQDTAKPPTAPLLLAA